MMKEADISIHGNSLTPEAIQRLAAHISPGKLGDQRQLILETARGGLVRMREDCEHLGRVFGTHEPVATTTMITGLDMFTDGFIKLIESVIPETDRGAEGKIVYIE